MKKILLIVSVITLFTACKKDFSVWKEYNDAEFKKFETNLGNNSSYVTESFKTPSGALVEVFHRGQTGKIPKLADYIYCKQSGCLIDGTFFEPMDSRSYYVLDKQKGLSEALCKMPQGSHFIVYVPYELGYGKDGSKYYTFFIPPYSTLIYEIEIVDIEPNLP